MAALKPQHTNVYLELFQERMRDAPVDLHRFCDLSYDEDRRRELIAWIRDLSCDVSPQYLQIKFSFSVPNTLALETIASLGIPLVSLGSGTGYWESLIQHRGVPIHAFDSNQRYPQEMRFIPVEVSCVEEETFV